MLNTVRLLPLQISLYHCVPVCMLPLDHNACTGSGACSGRAHVLSLCLRPECLFSQCEPLGFIFPWCLVDFSRNDVCSHQIVQQQQTHLSLTSWSREFNWVMGAWEEEILEENVLSGAQVPYRQTPLIACVPTS